MSSCQKKLSSCQNSQFKLNNSQSQAKPRITPNSKFKTHNSGDMSPDNLVFCSAMAPFLHNHSAIPTEQY